MTAWSGETNSAIDPPRKPVSAITMHGYSKSTDTFIILTLSFLVNQ